MRRHDADADANYRSIQPNPNRDPANTTETTAPTPMTEFTSIPAPVVDLDTKIGQMLMLGFRGMTLTPDNSLAADLRDRKIGSVVLFQYDSELKTFVRNIESAEQLRALNQSLQAISPIPLLISIDQEGGLISRLNERKGFPTTQSQKYYGDMNDAALTRRAAETEGELLRDLGINWNLAPVVDVAVNPDNPIIAKFERSFSADPAIVTAQAAAEIEGYHAAGILTTLKHFPGHGSSTGDSHLGLVDVTTTWQARELEPYRDLIKAGLADAVMTAHIFNSNLDPDYPATLSHKIITGILREQLGFDGVVISDDMQMGAIRNDFGYARAIELAINAGVDILAIANNLVHDPELGARTVGIIQGLVRDGKVTPERIDQSYQRIMRLKARIPS
ncbi:MAG: glycoside hydrolase family 3 [Anaerolineae bacterium]|nr:glycoside hydrolase family 3 [Anaerolineae bacterium]